MPFNRDDSLLKRRVRFLPAKGLPLVGTANAHQRRTWTAGRKHYHVHGGDANTYLSYTYPMPCTSGLIQQVESIRVFDTHDRTVPEEQRAEPVPAVRPPLSKYCMYIKVAGSTSHN